MIEVSDLEEPLEEEEEPPVVVAAEAPAIAGSEQPTPAPDDRATAARPPAPAPAPATAQDGPSGLAVAGSAVEITPAAQALYDQGYSLYHQGRFVDAEETFGRFLAAYSATDLGDNALFWIGQCRLSRNELQSALAAFRQAVREHPGGNKVPDALLQAGEVLERLGDADEARATYQDLERRYPGSTASAEAAKRRARLGPA